MPVTNRQPLSTGQVAELFGVKPETVARWADEGKLPCFSTPGGHRRFLYAEIAHLLPPPPATTPAEAS